MPLAHVKIISLHCLKENVETLDWNQSLNNHLDNITAMWNKYDMNNYDPSAQWGKDFWLLVTQFLKHPEYL